MPQFDRRRARLVPIDFTATETLENLPHSEYISLVLATDGKASIIMNGAAITLTAPCVLFLSSRDTFQVLDNSHLYAQSFSLDPEFAKNKFTFQEIKHRVKSERDKSYTENILMLFFTRTNQYTGILNLSPQIYHKLFEWFSIIGTEIIAQSDGMWTCRIRRYFLQILNLLESIYEKHDKANDGQKNESPVDAVMEYIHTAYMDEITLEKLCTLTHINRTSLNRMYKERTGQTAIEYLLNYRLRIAREMLAHTGLTIDEIAGATGFGYDTYLIRQFTAKMGETPTEYRRAVREKNGIIIQKI